MMRFGRSLELELFGSSHGPEVGVVVRGIPAGTPVDTDAVQRDLDRRRPVGRRLATRRHEEDQLVVDSGVADRRSTGGAIRAHVANQDARPSDYERLRQVPRPGHADYPARIRYGPEADLAGGGIFSGRMTVGLVIAGALVRPMLDGLGVSVVAFTRALGGTRASIDANLPLAELAGRVATNEVGTPDPDVVERMEGAISAARKAGDSVGGVVECWAAGLPVGLGEPFFDSIESAVAHLLFSIPAVKAVEFGDGILGVDRRGSEHNDAFYLDGDRVRTRTNHSGGVLGGLADGEPLVVRAFVKPTASIALPQESVDLGTRTATKLRITGRHDPCIVPRAVVVVESAVRFVLADLARTGGFL